MSLKLPTIFIILLITLVPLSSFAISDNELMKKYPVPIEVQNAINDGSLSYNELSKTMKQIFHDKPSQSEVTNVKQTDTTVGIVFLSLGSFVIIIFLITFNKHKKMFKFGLIFWFVSLFTSANVYLTNFVDSNGKIGAVIITLGIGIGIGIALVVRGKQEEDFKGHKYTKSNVGISKEETNYDLSTIEDSLYNHDPTFSHIKPIKKNTKINDNINSNQEQIKTIHKVLLSLGILKVKKQ